MKGGGHLDESVQKTFAVARCFQPDSFERLMGLKISLRVEQADSFRELLFHGRPANVALVICRPRRKRRQMARTRPASPGGRESTSRAPGARGSDSASGWARRRAG